MQSRLIYLIASLWLLSNATFAHQLSTAYLNGTLGETGIFEGEWQIRLYDLEQAIGVDSNQDGTLLWGELQARAQEADNYLSNHLRFERGELPCSLLIDSAWQVTEHFNEGYLVLPVRAQCPITGDLHIHYSAFFKEDSEHKLLVSVATEPTTETDSHISSRVISNTQRNVTLSYDNGNTWLTFQEFVVQGVIHIWKGLDHILFLLSLLLTCVLTRKQHHWVGKNSVRDIVIDTTWIVTAFTLAHSITLTATALGWINFPSRWVEVGIAASVAVAALNNIFPLVTRLGWLTFAFGLLHGMGFAGVLGELGLPADQKVLTVLAFNIGVEIGQMVIVVAVLPLLILVRNSIWYSRYSLAAVSVVIALIALQWVFERF
ncbi:MAG TPA: HupE/UreJ family protein [Cellvibrio sp.]|nr:HupE/UreJ family protein [Cellvibrio sp.]